MCFELVYIYCEVKFESNFRPICICGTVIYTTMWWLNRNFNGIMGERWPILGNCDIVAIV